jgi:hypothetical protein
MVRHRSPTLAAVRWATGWAGGPRWIGATLVVTLALAAAGCGSAADDGAVTTGDEQAVTADWRQALIATPRQADEDAYCATLDAGLALPADDEAQTLVFVNPGGTAEDHDVLRASIERITGAETDLVSEAEVAAEVEELLQLLPPEARTVPDLGPRIELRAPVDDAQRSAIEAERGVRNVLVRDPALARRPTVLDTLAIMWPRRLATSDIILFLHPRLGDGPLADLEAELRADHADDIA